LTRYSSTIPNRQYIMTYLVIPDLSKNPETLPPHPYSFSLDPFQQHAICAIAKGENVLVCAKTGSGKTLVGEYQIYHSLQQGKRVFYTTPIKSLSNQKFHDLKQQFPEASVGIMTGDIKFCPDAQIVIMTTEILRNLLYKKGTTTEHLGLTASISMENLDAVIFDECHYINDKDRGKVWEETMILLPPSIHLVMLSATLDHPEYLANWLGILKQTPIHLIETQYRIVPLIHNLLDKNYKLIPLMNAKEVYNEKVYLDWLQNQQDAQDNKKEFNRRVKEARMQGREGALDGKVSIHSFVHEMNEAIKMLQEKELLPALFFVLNRKQCENYANKVEQVLLSPSETASVKHIIGFHLHRHMKHLETVPQYHQIYELLCRGVAFHHSGLLPLLKEIVEILFSKGLVKMMFCTETFAVGLNMPTKTVLFGGLKKYDEQTAGMRMLRHDEYIQMAGRAGRRGKDDKGIVIYLPEREPVEPSEMKSMMKGTKPPIISRMDFHYDFILKTIQASEPNQPLKWLEIMEQSYWFQQRKKQITEIKKQLSDFNNKIKTLTLEEKTLAECKKRFELEQKIKLATNAARKEIQRELDSMKNRQFGPKWTEAWSNFSTLQIINREKEILEQDLTTLEDHKDSIHPSVNFLHHIGYLLQDNPLSLQRSDLTLKGILATEVNEGHQILMTELYTRGLAHQLGGNDLVTILACFQEDKETEESPSIYKIDIPEEVRSILLTIHKIAMDFQKKEEEIGYPISDYWTISTRMIEPMRRWIQGENASIICFEHDIFEGNFIRTVMKMGNMLDEWLAMATYCQHTEQIEKIMEVRQRMIRDIVISDSLYLHL
jgi:superfamily II RNA helicase